MSTETDALILTQLMAINNKLGTVDAKLEAGASLHKEMAQQIQMIDRRTDICEGETLKIKEILIPDDGSMPLVKRVEVLEIFHGKVGAIVMAATAVMTGAGYLLYAGFSMFSEEIKTFFRGLFGR